MSSCLNDFFDDFPPDRTVPGGAFDQNADIFMVDGV
jgi:hypothetical protein